MKINIRRALVFALLVVLQLSSQTFAQTATTSTITGLVTDAQGAAVAGATATLKDKATGQEKTAVTDSEGKYSFSNLNAGNYDLTIAAQGFGAKTFADIKADVTKTVTQDVALEVGTVTEQVVVTAGDQGLLQTQDATIGNTIENRRVTVLPNINRDATELLALQPGISTTGEATGARSDQSTLTLDGIDVTDNNLGAAFRSVIPTPNEAIEEFRVSTANPNATFGRSSGAQAVFVTKRGGNEWHGSAYEYHRNSALNANTWHNNRTGVPRAFLIDNRFGGTVSGPVFKDKTFFFLLLEGRRSVSSTTSQRLVPTATLKQGLLLFRDAGGAVQTIDPRTLDPRGLGASPAVLALLNLFPAPNDFSLGDGLNTAGLTKNIPTSQNSELGIMRVDHAFNGNWNFDGSFKAFREINPLAGNATQVDIANGRATAINTQRPRSLSLGLTGVLSPRLTNEFRFGWVHDRLAFNRESPVPQVPGVNIALDLAGALLDEPVDVDTQRTRLSARTMNIYQFIDNLTWTKNTHTAQAGFNIRRIDSFDLRVDKVVGSVAFPVAGLGSVSNNLIPAAERPGFIRAADLSRYNQLYAALLGEVETITYLATRGGDLEPNAIGTPLITNSKLHAFEFYGADAWRATPSLTINYGVMYSWQTPPTEAEGKQTVAVYSGTNELINPKDYLRRKFDAASRGEVFNPDIAYIPINESGRSGAFNIDWKNVSPRFAVAWSPTFREGFWGRLLGDNDTVFRGGYSLLFDRQNTVQTITIPTLGVGFAQTVAINNARNAAGQRFRAGVDGPLPLPTLGSADSPIIPAKPFGETLSFVVDPFSTVPRSHTINFTVQRSLPGNMVVEVGYAGRLGRNLYQSLNLNQVPYNFRDNASGQTFAEAFDALAAQLRSGTAASAVTAQPWFENLLVNLAPANGSRTRALAARQTADIVNGNLNNLFVGSLDVLAAQPFNNRQSNELFYRTSIGRSNYHALVATLRKRFSQGLSLDVNYTLSRSLDQAGAVQNTANIQPNSFNPDAEYVVSAFDQTHNFNTNYVYDLPFGRGKRFGGGASGVVDKLISGWFTSGIFRAVSGTPIYIQQGTQVWGGSQLLGFGSGAILLTGANFETGVHSGVPGSNGVGTTANPANGGTGLNIFADPSAVFNGVRRVQISRDERSGRNALRGLGFWQADMSFGKTTNITEKVRFTLTADFINIFNKVNFADPNAAAPSLQTPASFGVLTTQGTSLLQNINPRFIQFGGRVEF
jgi:hypothetical protein